jgi:hypothetical protein
MGRNSRISVRLSHSISFVFRCGRFWNQYLILVRCDFVCLVKISGMGNLRNFLHLVFKY